MTDLARDLQYGIRMLWKFKGFTLVAVLSIGRTEAGLRMS